MAGKGTKVKALARELGVTSRAVVDRCRAAGLPVQNSVTRLSPGVAAQVRVWFAGGGEDGAGEASSGDARAPERRADSIS